MEQSTSSYEFSIPDIVVTADTGETRGVVSAASHFENSGAPGELPDGAEDRVRCGLLNLDATLQKKNYYSNVYPVPRQSYRFERCLPCTDSSRES